MVGIRPCLSIIPMQTDDDQRSDERKPKQEGDHGYRHVASPSLSCLAWVSGEHHRINQLSVNSTKWTFTERRTDTWKPID